MNKFENSICRVEEVLPIAVMISSDNSACDLLLEFANDLDDRPVKHLADDGMAWLPKFLKWAKDLPHLEFQEEFTAALYENGTLGWLVKFAQPVLRYADKDSSGYSWGYHQTYWFYADTYEAAIEKGLNWAEANLEKQRAKLMAKAGAA